MSVIRWATGVNGDFLAAGDWTGGVTPGAGDIAEINATVHGRRGYTITLTSPVTLGGLVLDAAGGTLVASSAITTPSIDLVKGELVLSGGAAVSGTIIADGGVLGIENGTTSFNGVTVRGSLTTVLPKKGKLGTVTISNGLTLTGLNGTGPGYANIYADVNLNGVNRLDNGTLYTYSLAFYNTSTLTLGSSLDFRAGRLTVGTNQTLINNGNANIDLYEKGVTGTTSFVNNGSAMVSDDFSKGTITNAGTLEAGYLTTGKFLNSGLITVNTHEYLGVTYGKYSTQGAGQITVGGYGVLSVLGSFTTAELMAFFTNQHVSFSGTHYGTGVQGSLNNTGATLDIGTGTILNNFNGATVTGGTLTDHGGGEGQPTKLTLNSVTFHAAAAKLYSVSLTNVTLDNVSTLSLLDSTIANSTLSGVGNLVTTGTVTLDGTNFTGLGAAGPSITDTGTLVLAASQSIAGYNLSIAGGLSLASGATYDSATILINSGQNNYLIAGDSSGDSTLGAGVHLMLAANASLVLDGTSFTNGLDFKGTLTSLAGTASVVSINRFFRNDGVVTLSAGCSFTANNTIGSGNIINTGTITLTGGELSVNVPDLTNTGTMSVTNGTLALGGGTFSLDAFNQVNTTIGHSGSQEILLGTLALGGGTLTLGAGAGGVPNLVLGQFNQAFRDVGIIDGTVKITAGQTLTVTAAGHSVVSAQVVNNGTIVVTTGYGYVQTLSGAVSGGGTIQLNGSATANEAANLSITTALGSQQVVAFNGQNTILGFANTAAAATHAKISGFAVTDRLVFSGENVTGASFVGSSIVATLAGGGSITLSTTSALTGSLSVVEGGGNATLTYASTAASVHDWSAGDIGGHGAAGTPPHGAQGVLHDLENVAMPHDLFLPHGFAL